MGGRKKTYTCMLTILDALALYTTGSKYTCTMFAGYYSINGQLPMATVVHLAVFGGPCSGRIAIALTQVRGKTMGIVCIEILLELTSGPICTRSHE